MSAPADQEQLQAYLDRTLSGAEQAALEQRLRTEPALAEQLIRLAREETLLGEWGRAMRVTAQVEHEYAHRQPPVARPVLTRLRVVISILAAVVLLAILGILLPRPVPPDINLAYLDEVQGEVELSRPSGERTQARSGQPLEPGQQVRTGGEGSFAVVRYPDGTRLEMSTDTILSLLPQNNKTAEGEKRVHLSEGFVQAEVAPHSPQQPLILSTPHAQVRAPATRFLSTSSPRGTRIDLEQGRLEVTRTSDGQMVEVEEGRYTVVSTLERPLTSRPLPPRITHPRATLLEEAGPVMAVAFAPDGRRLAVGGWKGAVTLWDPVTAMRSLSMRSDHSPKKVNSLAWGGRGEFLISSGHDRQVKLHDPLTGEGRLTFPKNRTEVLGVALHPTQHLLATIPWREGRDTQLVGIKLWDATTGADRGVLWGHPIGFRSVAFSHDGKMLAAGCDNGELKLWDVVRRTELLSLRAHASALTTLAFSPDDRVLVTGSRDRTMKIWEIRSGDLIRTLRGHPREINAVAFSPDGRLLASVGGGSTMVLWDVHTWQEVRRLTGHKFTVTAVAFAPDGKTLATAGWDRTVKLWDLRDLVLPPATTH